MMGVYVEDLSKPRTCECCPIRITFCTCGCDMDHCMISSDSQWISAAERLPEEPYGCLAIVWDNPRYGGDMFLNYYPEFVGWDGETWNDADGEEIPFDVVYWMKMPQIPEPPKEET